METRLCQHPCPAPAPPGALLLSHLRHSSTGCPHPATKRGEPGGKKLPVAEPVPLQTGLFDQRFSGTPQAGVCCEPSRMLCRFLDTTSIRLGAEVTATRWQPG